MIRSGAWIVHKQPAGIDDNFSCGIELNERTIHGARSGTFEIHALTVVSAAVARAFELVFRALPFRRAAEVSAAREDYENAIRLANNPDAIGHQEALVDTEREIGRKADIKYGIWFVEDARKEKPQKHQEIYAEIAPDTRPDDAAAGEIDFLLDYFCVRRAGRFCDLPCGGFWHRPV